MLHIQRVNAILRSLALLTVAVAALGARSNRVLEEEVQREVRYQRADTPTPFPVTFPHCVGGVPLD